MCQRPMCGYTPYGIREHNYLEFQTKWNDWYFKHDDEGFMMFTEVEGYGYAYYYFHADESTNYRYALSTTNFTDFTQLRTDTLTACEYVSDGWYLQNTGLYVRFKQVEIDGTDYYVVIYSLDIN